MKWIKQGSKQIAKGDYGQFEITRRSGFYFGKYISEEKTFNFPRTRTIKEMKDRMQENFYWEE